VSAAEAASPLTRAQAADLFADLADSRGLIIAVSGGPDSTALLVLLAEWRAALAAPPPILAITVDHGLRPQGRSEAGAVKQLARDLGIPHRTLRWRGEKPGAGLQEAARNARYGLLLEAARRMKASHVLTGHTRDDQAETVLFRMARGSGLSGLAGMARSSALPLACENRQGEPITLVRPFLEMPKARLIATLEARGIPFALDPSNDDPRFTRSRLRKLMPLLAAEGLEASRFDTLAARLRRADEALDQITQATLRRHLSRDGPDGRRISIGWAAISACPTEISLRTLQQMIRIAGDGEAPELRKLETLWEALEAAARMATPVRRTLAGAMVTFKGQELLVECAPPRRLVATRSKTPAIRPPPG
jgi:tRNA(Ile)-lysidine synthase